MCSNFQALFDSEILLRATAVKTKAPTVQTKAPTVQKKTQKKQKTWAGTGPYFSIGTLGTCLRRQIFGSKNF